MRPIAPLINDILKSSNKNEQTFQADFDYAFY